MQTALESAQRRVQEETERMELAQRLSTIIPNGLPVLPWIIAKHHTNVPYITFKVTTLNELKKMFEMLPPTLSSVVLELSYGVGNHVGNRYKWEWISSEGETIEIGCECYETIGRATADKKIKYYYKPGYLLEVDKFNMNQPDQSWTYSPDRSEFSPTFNLRWFKGKLPFKT